MRVGTLQTTRPPHIILYRLDAFGLLNGIETVTDEAKSLRGAPVG